MYRLSSLVFALLLGVCGAATSCAGDSGPILSERFDSETVLGRWTVDSLPDGASVRIDPAAGPDGGGCLAVESRERACVAVRRRIEGLRPGAIYRFGATVRTEEVAEGRGAVLFLDMEAHADQPWNASEFLYGDNDWREVHVDFTPARDGSATVCCGLGFPEGTYNGGVASGRVYYDRVWIEEVTDSLRLYEGEHIRIALEPAMVTVDDEAMERLVACWDRVYEAYGDLVGGFPYDGEKILILSTPGMERGYWALAGNPILWNAGVKNAQLFERFAAQGDWGFGLMHEIGHDFNQTGCTAWNWNDEIFANFRMSYALEALGGTMSQRDVLYTGDNTDYYKLAYDATLGRGLAENNGDALHYTYMRIKNRYGWEPFKAAFRELRAADDASFEGMSRWEKVCNFWRVVSKHAGEDVAATCYTPDEMRMLEACWQ